jgi:hypothetical protein
LASRHPRTAPERVVDEGRDVPDGFRADEWADLVGGVERGPTRNALTCIASRVTNSQLLVDVACEYQTKT